MSYDPKKRKRSSDWHEDLSAALEQLPPKRKRRLLTERGRGILVGLAVAAAVLIIYLIAR